MSATRPSSRLAVLALFAISCVTIATGTWLLTVPERGREG
jgi:hypothetical protein